MDIAETPTRTTFHATFVKNGQEILVTIASLTEPSTRTYEKDGDDIYVYSSTELNITSCRILTIPMWCGKQELLSAKFLGRYHQKMQKR